MAKKSKSADIAVQSTNDESSVIDVNLAVQANEDKTDNAVSGDTEVKEETPSSEPSKTPTETPSSEPSKTPTETPSEKPSEKPTSSPEKQYATLSKSFKEATGVLGYDIDNILSSCKSEEDKKAAYERIIWHIGRIHSCCDSTHVFHQGRFAQDGTESKLVKDLKAAFGQK